MQQSLSKLTFVEMLWFKRSLCNQYKTQFEISQLEESDVLDVVDRLLERCGKGEAVHIAIQVLQEINKRIFADELEKTCERGRVHERNKPFYFYIFLILQFSHQG